ncbi:MAG: GNAT family N-acetyltransferase [Steroidobacteraceae bacterium]
MGKQREVELDVSMQVRLAKLGDVAALSSLTAELGYPASVTEMTTRLSALLARTDHAVFVVEHAQNVVGWLHVGEVLSLESAPFAVIGGLVVAEGQRGAGRGRALVSAAEQWAVARAYGKIRVRSNSMRVEARQFYEKLAFVVTKNQNVFDKLL